MHLALRSTLLTLALSTTIGCAASPESIPPAYVSELTYMHLTAEQLGQEQLRLIAALSAASDAQRQARSNDAAGIILLGLPVSSLSGSNQASNIARLKGELEAVQKVIVRQGFDIEIVPATQIVGEPPKRRDDSGPQPFVWTSEAAAPAEPTTD